MAGKSAYLENMILSLIFNGSTNALLASAAGSLSDLYVALHTANPGDSGSQTTNEVTTTQDATYARVSVARSSGGWTVSSASPTKVNPVGVITFPTTSAVGTGCTATYFSIGTAASGAGNILYSGAISPAIVIPATTAGVIPQLTTATTISEE